MNKKMHSKTFCKMPFVGLQATHNGTRLCCSAKKLNVNGIKDFWESKYLAEVKNKMLRGESVSDCEQCYKTEAQGKISLRNHYNSLYKNTPIAETPTVLDVDFSNFCNLKCIMCGPERSSQWTKELGEETVSRTTEDQIDELCELSDNVKYLTIQGGEPSLMPEVEYYLGRLKEKGIIQNINLDCISNLTNINRKFYGLLEDFKSVNINASIDAYNLANDYIRYPSNFKKIEDNLLELADRSIQVNLQISIQTLTMFNFYDFLSWIAYVQSKFEFKNKTLGVNLSYVNRPECLNIQNSPKRLKEKMIADITKFKLQSQSHKRNSKFNIELWNIKRTLSETLKESNTDRLKEYIDRLDQRRNIKITNYIPDFHNYI